jgi:hypothetical protein
MQLLVMDTHSHGPLGSPLVRVVGAGHRYMPTGASAWTDAAKAAYLLKS